MIQLTIMKITGYGPWTLTLGFDREHELQMLQSKLYNKLQEKQSIYINALNSMILNQQIK